jgi:hypothetical protein
MGSQAEPPGVRYALTITDDQIRHRFEFFESYGNRGNLAERK